MMKKFDLEILVAMLTHYVALPRTDRLSSYDKFFALTNITAKNFNEKKLRKQLNKMYKKTKLNSQEQRLALMTKSVSDFNNSKDPFIQLAVASFKERKTIER